MVQILVKRNYVAKKKKKCPTGLVAVKMYLFGLILQEFSISRQKKWCNIFICPFGAATHGRRGCGGRREIVLVIEGALYACPWGALRGSTDAEPLCERYALLAAPALRPLRHQRHLRARPNHEHGKKRSLKSSQFLIHILNCCLLDQIMFSLYLFTSLNVM